MIDEKLYASLSIDKKIFLNSIGGIFESKKVQALILWGLATIFLAKFAELLDPESAIYIYLLFFIMSIGMSWFSINKIQKQIKELEEKIMLKYFKIIPKND